MDATPKAVTGRVRRPSWTDPRLLGGIVLVALAVTATSAVVANADTTAPYLAARDTLTPGTVLEPDDVVIVHVRVDAAEYVDAEAPPYGKVVTRIVGAGELIPADALADAAVTDTRPVAVNVTTPLSGDVERGSVVDVWVTREDFEGAASQLVAQGLVVEDVQRDTGAFSTGADETVYVLVPAGEVGDLLAALAGDVGVTVVGGAGAVA